MTGKLGGLTGPLQYEHDFRLNTNDTDFRVNAFRYFNFGEGQGVKKWQYGSYFPPVRFRPFLKLIKLMEETKLDPLDAHGRTIEALCQLPQEILLYLNCKAPPANI